MRHLVAAHAVAGTTLPETVVELGPGLSLGTAICARLCGVKNYVALDAHRDVTIEHSLGLVPELVDLIDSRAEIPDDVEFPEVWPRLASYKFPQWLAPTSARETSECLLKALGQATEITLRNGQAGIRYIAPWSIASPPGDITNVDFVFSQAVFEHVERVEATHRLTASWLKAGGLIAHSIDFRSHGYTKAWYGHWEYPRGIWRIVTATSTTYLNRLPLSSHIATLKVAGFHIAGCRPLVAAPTASAPQSLVSRGVLSESDRSTMGAYVCARL